MRGNRGLGSPPVVLEGSAGQSLGRAGAAPGFPPKKGISVVPRKENVFLHIILIRTLLVLMLQNQWFPFKPKPSDEELELAVRHWPRQVPSQHCLAGGDRDLTLHSSGKQGEMWVITVQHFSAYPYL